MTTTPHDTWLDEVKAIIRANLGSRDPEHFAAIGLLGKYERQCAELERLQAVERDFSAMVVEARRDVLAELESLRAMKQRALEKANAPRRLDGAASWDVAAHILGERG